MTKLGTHLFREDASVPRDSKGRAYCTCGAVKDHERHTLPSVPAQAEVRGRYDHEDED